MIYKRLVLLLAWTVLWGGFAVDQLLLTYAHMQSRNIYGDKVMIERDGMKFLVDKDLVANEKIEARSRCIIHWILSDRESIYFVKPTISSMIFN